MNDCPTCGFPMVWNDEIRRQWCSVYGHHRERFKGRNVVKGAPPFHPESTRLSPSSTRLSLGTMTAPGGAY